MKPVLMIFLVTLLSGQELTKIPCSKCHAPDGWRPLASPMEFNHNKTNFILENQHVNANCIQCHPGNSKTEIHQFSSAESECVSCHMDIHFSRFGEACQDCHTAQNWSMDNWRMDHNRTLFPLAGAHGILPCESCHGENLSHLTDVLTTECNACHLNLILPSIQNGEHVDNADCQFCHNSRAWQPVDMAQHDFLFPIYSGKHRGEWSTCENECHINPSDYTNFSCGLNGICHEHRQSKMDDEHDERKDYSYESSACYNCHPTGSE